MIFYFSGCGNSKHVAETIAAGLNDKLIFIPEATRENRYNYTLAEGESLGFVFLGATEVSARFCEENDSEGP